MHLPSEEAFGQTRRVCWDSTISVEEVRYSVPHPYVDEPAWARWSGDELVVTVVADEGPVEIARHIRGQRGRPQLLDEHYPPEHPSQQATSGQRTPRASNPPRPRSCRSGRRGGMAGRGGWN